MINPTAFKELGALTVAVEDTLLPAMQKDCSMSSVIVKPGAAQFLAKVGNYIENERFPQLQIHELKKELYLRGLRLKK